MTRMNLTPYGTSWSRSPFKFMLLVFVGFLVIYYGIFLAMIVYAAQFPHGEVPNHSPYYSMMVTVKNCLHVAFSIYVVILICQTRAHVRRTYAIPEASCRGCEDCCCAYWCSCCTVAQMARHTADYRKYHAACCSETGLGDHAPPTISLHIV
jgi:Cys-rich protein (TIGR01571 family)